MTVKLEDLITSLGLEVGRGPGGKWVIPEHLAATLRDADRLSKDGAGTATMRRVLGITMAPVSPDPAAIEPSDPPPSPDPSAHAAEPAPDHALAGLVTTAVTTAVKAENELAEKYARAAHRIGDLEATTRALEAERDRLTGELAAARTERDQLRAESDELRMLLAARPASARPWWKVWG